MPAERAGGFAARLRRGASPLLALARLTLVPETPVPATAISESWKGNRPFPIDLPRLGGGIAGSESMFSRPAGEERAESAGPQIFSLRSRGDLSGRERSGADWIILKALFSLIYSC